MQTCSSSSTSYVDRMYTPPPPTVATRAPSASLAGAPSSPIVWRSDAMRSADVCVAGAPLLTDLCDLQPTVGSVSIHPLCSTEE